MWQMSTMGTHEMQQNKYSNIQENIQDKKKKDIYIYIYIYICIMYIYIYSRK